MNLKANMFNISAKQNAEAVLKRLDIKKSEIIADIGSGGGFFVFGFARLTGTGGKVYAVDIDDSLLAHIRKQIIKKKAGNVETVKADTNGPNLPERCGLIFLRDVFHHITDPAAYFERLRESLKPGGSIAIIDWKPRKSHHGHGSSKEKIENSMKSAGYELFESYDILKKQVFCIFKKASECR